jgi:hypothetical protein
MTQIDIQEIQGDAISLQFPRDQHRLDGVAHVPERGIQAGDER